MSKQTKPSRKLSVYYRQQKMCCWCGLQMERHELTWEHIIPKSLGGTDCKANMALAHYKCNRDRSASLDAKPYPDPVFDFIRKRLAATRRGYTKGFSHTEGAAP